MTTSNPLPSGTLIFAIILSSVLCQAPVQVSLCRPFLSKNLYNLLILSLFSYDVVNEYMRIRLPLTVNSAKSLIVVLKIPGNSEPYNMMARSL